VSLSPTVLLRGEPAIDSRLFSSLLALGLAVLVPLFLHLIRSYRRH
jgi:hypothetical protein